MEGFLFNGIWITDPFMDETGRFPVDPKEYYGMDEELKRLGVKPLRHPTDVDTSTLPKGEF